MSSCYTPQRPSYLEEVKVQPGGNQDPDEFFNIDGFIIEASGSNQNGLTGAMPLRI